MGFLSGLFKRDSKRKSVMELVNENAEIIDVRTASEFKSGHVKGSRNIPLQQIPSNIESIKEMDKPVILCCASGMRSARATKILKKHDINCVNGGGWTQVNQVLKAMK